MQHEQFENQWKMRGSNSEMLQIQLKWQLPAANGKENGQKSRSNMIHQKKPNTHTKKLDDGWPESVEEQSLLLLVWKHYIRRQYIKDV